MPFEWDDIKNLDNQKRHNISFEKAQHAFLDANRIILQDEKHSQSEERFFCIGEIDTGIVTIRFTMRENNIRIFGAGYWREGKKLYEDR